jgi:L-iditol 2-dehydrogenase
MQAAQLAALRRFDIRQVPDPKIVNDKDVLIRIATVGICGSDIHYFTEGRIGSQVIRFPFTIGHEASGVVEATGRSVTRVHVGQRTAIDPALSCGRCDQCQAGRENTCRDLLFLGCPGQLSGCLCEYVVLHERCCYPMDDSMTFEQASLSEPLAIALYAVERSRPAAEASIAVLGTGPIGMSVLHALRTQVHGRIFATDKIDERLKHAQTLNPTWCGNPQRQDVVSEIRNREPSLLDVVYECTGSEQAIVQATSLLKPGGTLVLIGIPEVDTIPFPIHELRRNELTIVNIRRQAHCTAQAIDALQANRINLDALVTHRFHLDQIQEAFELVAGYRDGVMKAMISMG